MCNYDELLYLERNLHGRTDGRTEIKLRKQLIVNENIINPYNTELFILNFQSPEVVSRHRDPQLQVTENLCSSRNLSPNIYQFQDLRHILI